MTATPKIYGENVKSKVEEDTVITLWMIKKLLEKFYIICHLAGVQKGLLTDYK